MDGGLDESEVMRLFHGIGDLDQFPAFREEMLERTLPWGMSAVGRWLTDLAKERGLCLAKELEYLPSMIKYGVPSPMACYLVRRGVSRRGAVSASSLLATHSDNLENAFPVDSLDAPPDSWSEVWTPENASRILGALSERQIEGLQLDQKDIERLIALRQSTIKM